MGAGLTGTPTALEFLTNRMVTGFIQSLAIGINPHF